MSDILFIKTSSLGDVIHHMPAVTDARRHQPDARIGWVVEEAFAPLVRLHRAVEAVIPVSSRRWRRAPFSPATWREIGAFRRAMREQTHETVIDAQGRVVIHSRLRDSAQITGDVDVLGQQSYLEVWNHERLVAKLSAEPFTDDDAKALSDFGI